MTWDAYHRRGDVLRAVVDEADRRRDGVPPTDVPGLHAVFPDELSLVGALQLRWHTRLAGHIERALADRPADPATAVVHAWRDAARELAGVRAILDAKAKAPTGPAMADALERARRKERTMLAALAGQASAADPEAAGVGRRLEELARAGFDPRQGSPRGRTCRRAPRRPSGLLDRLRGRIAA